MTRGSYEVIVVGGGPAGVAAAVAAARTGSEVALLERESTLGGAGTVNLVNNFINAYWDGERYVIGGLFLEIRDRLFGRKAIYRTRGPTQDDKHGQEPFDPDAYAEELRILCEEAGVEVLFETPVTGATVENGRIRSLEVPSGELGADTVVDATGGASVAAHTGAPTVLGSEDEPLQPLTYMYMVAPVDLDALEEFLPRATMYDANLEERWADLSHLEEVNDLVEQAKEAGELSFPAATITTLRSVPGAPTRFAVNFGYVPIEDPTDEEELAAATETGRAQMNEGVAFLREHVPGFADVEVVREGSRIGVRESRRLVGKYTLTAEDLVACRQFDDVIAQSCFPFDIHRAEGDWGWAEDMFDTGEHYDISLRSLVPADGPGNLVVGGKCISADPAAFSSLRVSSSAMAIGEAAGIVAALAARRSCAIADVDASEVQAQLLEARAILE